VRKNIVEGDDFSVLPAPVVVLLRRIARLFNRRRGQDQLSPPETDEPGRP
jgi:hypothetical protein